MSTTRSLAEVAADLRMKEWTLAQLVRDGRAPHLRLGKKPAPGSPDHRPIRFTDEQVAQILAEMTVAPAEVTPMRRRKRRAS